MNGVLRLLVILLVGCYMTVECIQPRDVAATSMQAGAACKHASMGYGPLDGHLTID
jgi:hypothetical protein